MITIAAGSNGLRNSMTVMRVISTTIFVRIIILRRRFRVIKIIVGW